MQSALRLAALSLAALAGCTPYVAGNGVYREKVIDVAPFDSIDVDLGIEVTVTAGTATRSVKLSGDENLIEHIQVRVVDGVLTTSTDLGDFDEVLPLRLVISAPELVAVKAREAATVQVSGAAAPAFAVDAGGAARVTLAGAGGESLTAGLGGGAELDAHAYPVTSATVQLAGGSHGRVNASGDVSGTAAEASLLELSGGATCAGVVLSSGATCEP